MKGIILTVLISANLTLALSPLYSKINTRRENIQTPEILEENESFRRNAKFGKENKMLRILTNQMDDVEKKAVLRVAAEEDLVEFVPENEDPNEIIEHELLEAQAKKSALFDRPHVEHQGRNDYLVMGPVYNDPFVTIPPNSIYYNVEKKCVNWLDDCSSNGIRSKLLQHIRGPN